MSERSSSGKWIALAAVWLVLSGIAAATYRLLVVPAQREEAVKRTGSDPRFAEQARVALDSFSGYAVLRSDEFRQELANHAVGLELVDDGADYAARLRSLQRGETHLAAFTLDALLVASEALGDAPATVVLVLDETIGADALVAYRQNTPDISALDDPRARIVATRNSPSETLSRVVMANFSLPKLDPQPWIPANGAQDVYERMRADRGTEPRAYALWEPYVSRALELPGAHVLMDSSKFRGYIVDVLVADRRYLAKHEDRVKLFVEAYLRAAHASRTRAGGLAALVEADAKRLGAPLTSAQSTALAERVWWKNSQENYAHFGVLGADGAPGKSLQHLDAMLRNIQTALRKTGGLKTDPTAGQPHLWYYDRIVRRLHDERFHPSILAGSADEQVRAAVDL